MERTEVDGASEAADRVVTAGAAESRRIRLVGVPVDAVCMEEAVDRIAKAVSEQRRLRVFVVNANKAWQAGRDARLRTLLEQGDLVIAEWAMTWAADVLRSPRVEHVGGITLMVRLLAEAERQGWSTYLLGARPGVVELLRERLRRERPALRVVGSHHGYLEASAREKVVRELGELRPDLLFVAMGSPLQERFIGELAANAGPSVCMGVGGSFEVLAGLKRDAPSWARGRGLEWAYRLAQDPARLWKRYLVTNSWFIWSVLRERIRGRSRVPSPVR